MFVEAQTPAAQSNAVIADAVRAVTTAEKSRVPAAAIAESDAADPVPQLAQASTARAVRRFAEAKQSRSEAQATWTRRPAAWTPFATWADAERAWCAAREAWTDAFTESRRHSTPFINSPHTDPCARNAFVFSRTIDEALAKESNLPTELVAAMRAEEAARAHRNDVRQRAIQTPASGLDIVVKLRLITEEMDDVFDPLEPQDVKEAHKRPDEFSQANEFFALHDDIVRAAAASDEMFALSKELASLTTLEMAAQGEEEIDDAIDRSAVIAHEIMARPAHTVADFRAKAEAVKWACDSREGLDEQFAASSSTFMTFAHQLICELLDGAVPSKAPLQ